MIPFNPIPYRPRNRGWGAEGDLWYHGPNGIWVSIPHPGVAGQAVISTEDGWETGEATGGGGVDDASFLVLGAHPDLTDERVFVPSARFVEDDDGPGNPYNLDLSDNLRYVVWPIVLGHPSGPILTAGTHWSGFLNPHGGVIVDWVLTSDVSTTATVDILAANYATWPVTASLWGTKPSLTAVRKNRAASAPISVAITAGHLWDLSVDANDNAHQLTLNLLILRS